jgi:hypothetical protein
MTKNLKVFLLSLSLLLFPNTFLAKLSLTVIKPVMLQKHFPAGLEFKEIINGHRLRSFEDKVNIHILHGDNGTGCTRFKTSDVIFLLGFYSIFI